MGDDFLPFEMGIQHDTTPKFNMEPEKSILEVRNMFWPFSDSNI
jgi:hypothetical protein